MHSVVKQAKERIQHNQNLLTLQDNILLQRIALTYHSLQFISLNERERAVVELLIRENYLTLRDSGTIIKQSHTL